VSERRAARLLELDRATPRYRSYKDREEGLRHRLRELAANRVRYGYRRLTVLLQREGWKVNAKRIYRIYSEEGLTVRKPQRKKLASGTRIPLSAAVRPNQRWNMDFMAARLHDNRLFRILTVIDQYTRECVALIADQRMNGSKVSIALSQAIEEREATPESITGDNASANPGQGFATPAAAALDPSRRLPKSDLVWPENLNVLNFNNLRTHYAERYENVTNV